MNTNIRVQPYKKDFEYSYSIGVFPTLELLTHQPDKVIKVLLSSKSSLNSGVAKIRELCHQHGIMVETADAFISKVTGKENSYAVGVFNKYDTIINPSENHLVLVGIRDMGNLGTICRTLLGFNISNLAIIKPAADIFDPKVIRASMGALFQLNFQYFESFEQYQETTSNHLYPFMTDGAQSLRVINFQKPYSLVFGSEAAGLDASFQGVGTSVMIPQSDKVDSLNLSIAVGIALYQSQA
jgi:TrmH family RNA methyltransferase